jgi:integrase/recombinase XerD
VPLVKFERPNGYWYLRGTVRGQSIYESTRTRDEKVAEAAREAREDELIENSIRGIKSTVKFEAAAASYVREGGPAQYLLEVKSDGKPRGLVEHFKGQKLRDIGQSELDAAARALFPKASPATRNRHVYTPFIAVWNHAVSNKWADEHKWRRPRQRKGTRVSTGPVRAGTLPVSYERAWEFVRAMSPAAACVMTALFYTGMRPIELFSLIAEDVSADDRWITLPSSKTDEPRGIPMHEVLVPMMTALAGRGGRLFRTHKDHPYPLKEDGGGQIKGAIAGARGRTKIMGISPYTARHTVSTQLVIEGVHPHIKDQILGHAVTSMSRSYTHVPQPEMIEAINKLPVIEAWRDAPWMADPIAWQRRLVRFENNGKAGRKSTKSVQHIPKWAISA